MIKRLHSCRGCDYSLRTTDLFVKDGNPTEAAVQQLDTSPFRWVMQVPRAPISTRRPRGDLSTAYVDTMEHTCLGNVVVPILANFSERNLVAPTQTSGTVTTIRNGHVVDTVNLTPLASEAQRIFDGSLDGPADYDNDTRVEFTFTSTDAYGAVAQGQAVFCGKSILYWQSVIRYSVFDPAKVGKFEAIARELIERGLIDIAIHLPRGGPPRPEPDPLRLLNRLRSHRPLQTMIDQALGPLWDSPSTWKSVLDAQSEAIGEMRLDTPLLVDSQASSGAGLQAAHELKETEQRQVDAVILNVFVDSTIAKLRRDPDVIRILRPL